jgi:hypothetical protein
VRGAANINAKIHGKNYKNSKNSSDAIEELIAIHNSLNQKPF